MSPVMQRRSSMPRFQLDADSIFEERAGIFGKNLHRDHRPAAETIRTLSTLPARPMSLLRPLANRPR